MNLESFANQYGTAGMATYEKMTRLLKSEGLQIAHDGKSRFTILKSSNLNQQKVPEIFDRETYQYWRNHLCIYQKKD